MSLLFGFLDVTRPSFSVSGSNLASHIVGSLKKGKSLTPIPPTAYNTLPSHAHHHAARSNSTAQHQESGGLAIPIVHAAAAVHKRSPSTDSGNAGSRSTTPVSYRLGKEERPLHTVYRMCATCGAHCVPYPAL